MAQTYEQWEARVDQLTNEMVDLDLIELPDVLDSRGAYDGGDTPAEFVAALLEDLGFEGG